MSALERRSAHWSDVIGDLLLQHHTEFPRWAVADAISEDFGSDLAWSWMDGDDLGFELRHPVPGWPEPEALAFWERVGLDFHPIVRWFAATGQSSPMSTGRVPRTIAPEHCFAALRACMAPIGLEQQLSIPYVLAPDRHRAFVLAQSCEDYSDEDLEVARSLQPLLMLLERQVRVHEGRLGDPEEVRDESVLTGREHAVLVLLERGRTAEAIAHDLAISPRTVHKHLENLYRKLGVGDRLRAVAVAREAGLLAPHREHRPAATRRHPVGAGCDGMRWSAHVPRQTWVQERARTARG